MNLARITLDGAVGWGIVQDGQIALIKGDPYGQPPRTTGKTVRLDDARLLAPVTPSKIFAVGRNYEAHRIAMGMARSDVPATLMKPPTTVIGPGRDVVLPPRKQSREVAFEAELALVIGRVARGVSADDAAAFILGYTCADDISARDVQRGDPQPTRAKGFDTFCPVGPWIQTELDPVSGVRIRSWVNDELKQDSSTSDMTFDVGQIVAFVSGFATLLPGDLILTGSPAGSGTIAAGDRVAIEIDGIGVLRHGVAADEHSFQTSQVRKLSISGSPVRPGAGSTARERR